MTKDVATSTAAYERVVEEEISTLCDDDDDVVVDQTACRRLVEELLRQSRRRGFGETLSIHLDDRSSSERDGRPYFDLRAKLDDAALRDGAAAAALDPGLADALVGISDAVQTLDDEGDDLDRVAEELRAVAARARRGLPVADADAVEAIAEIAVGSAAYWRDARRDATNNYRRTVENADVVVATERRVVRRERRDVSTTAVGTRTTTRAELTVWDSSVVLGETVLDEVLVLTDEAANALADLVESVDNATEPFFSSAFNFLQTIAPYVLADVWGAIKTLVVQVILQGMLAVLSLGVLFNPIFLVFATVLGAIFESVMVADIFTVPNPLEVTVCLLVNLVPALGQTCQFENVFPPLVFEAFDGMEELYNTTADLLVDALGDYDMADLSVFSQGALEVFALFLNDTGILMDNDALLPALNAGIGIAAAAVLDVLSYLGDFVVGIYSSVWESVAGTVSFLASFFGVSL